MMIAAAASLVRFPVKFTRHWSSVPHNMLVDLVATGVGSLQDMESKLDNLEHSIPVTQSLITQVINSCSSSNIRCSRRLLRFVSWCRKKSNDELGDEVFNNALQAFSKMKDATAIEIALLDLERDGRRINPKTFENVVETFVKLGKPEKAVSLFRNIEEKCKIEWESDKSEGWSSVTSAVHALCAKGYARKAQGILWHHKDKVKNECQINHHRSLILHGWSVYGNAKEARRVIDEIKKSGNCPSIASYHDLLRCICHRNLKFNQSALVPEATNVMTEMRSSGVFPTTVSFNILLSCLGKARRVKESFRVFFSMLKGEEGEEAIPDSSSYYIVIRLLYLTGRFSNGNKILNKMIEEEDKGRVNLRANLRFYHDLIGVLCGIEEMEHALKVFEIMKNRCVTITIKDCGPTYDMLIAKLCRNGKFDLGRCLWDESIKQGITLECSSDLMDPMKAPEVFIPEMKSSVKSGKKDIAVSVKKRTKATNRKSKIKGKKGH